MSVKQSIKVTNAGLSPILSVAQGTGAIEYEFTVSDFDIPSGSAAVAYNIQPTGNIVSQTCSISGNTITVKPPAYYFLRGKNYMQFQVSRNNEDLFSFLIEVWCAPNISQPEVIVAENPSLVSQLISDVGLLSAQLDNLLSIPSGSLSTSSDAALADIKIGYDGTTYNTPGDAVRGQVSSLYEDIDELFYAEDKFDRNNLTSGFLDFHDGTVFANDDGWHVTDYISCKVFDRIRGAMTNGKNLVAICLYDEDKAFIKSVFSSETSADRVPIDYFITDIRCAYVRYNVFPESIFPYSQQYLDIVGGERLRLFLDITVKSFYQFNSTSASFELYNNIDNIPINSIFTYTRNVTSDMEGNVPFTDGFTVLTYNSTTTTYAGTIQLAISLLDNTLAIRSKTDHWTDWVKLTNHVPDNITLTVGSANSDFTTLKSVTEYIKNNSIIGAKVIVAPGIYNLVDEFTQEYLDSIVSDTNKGFGLMVGNDTHFIFNEGAKIVFDYSGQNADCAEYFSAFNLYGSVTLENANIEMSNGRYCVHEDLPTVIDSVPESYTAKYINCNMKHNGNTIGEYTGTVCIGAGTNKNSFSYILGGTYQCTDSFPYAISYHNYSGNEPSKLTIKNVWINNGIRLGQFSNSIVDVEISGCHIPNGIKSDQQHFNLKEWNNNSVSV